MRFFKPLLLAAFALFLTSSASASNDVFGQRDPHEVRFVENGQLILDPAFQNLIEKSIPWTQFKTSNTEWLASFDESNYKPSRAFGPAILVSGATAEQRAINFIEDNLALFNIPVDELELVNVIATAKHEMVLYKQMHNGLEVLFSNMNVKMTHDGGVTSWKAIAHSAIEVGTTPAITNEAMTLSAGSGIENVDATEIVGDLAILPIPVDHEYQFHLVARVMVSGIFDNGLPYRYNTLVDAETGEVLYRSNEISTFCNHNHSGDDEHGDDKASDESEAMIASATITGEHWTYDPSEPLETVAFPDMRVSVVGFDFFSNDAGTVTTNAVGPVNAQVQLRGNFARVFEGVSTPSFTVSLEEGPNDVTIASSISQEAISGYINTNVIHTYMKTIMPASFTNLDMELPVNIETTPAECNAFYNGTSINFFTGVADCVSLVNVSDVVFHEYGHGINGMYYNSLGASFQNGGMNEGYADVWGFAVYEDPLLGDGHDPTAPDNVIRQYDINPKVYPQDIQGEVHADGEIIAGAWWDTYVLLGNDMGMTMDLFVQAYPGLQATTFNGNEGVAFLDVLLDVLEADDDDGNILNGTPNGDAIAEAFAIHGITFLATAEIMHAALETAPANQAIVIEGELDISAQFVDYLDGVNLYYKLNNGTVFTTVPMTDLGSNMYSAEIPAQPQGTIVGYYMSVNDVFDNTSSVTPIAAHLEDPNLPNFVMVGYELHETYDSDDEEDVASWDIGLGSDNATTGEWEEANPIGSFADPITVAPDEQATPGGQFCFVTGNSVNPTDGIGVNDVDGGTTTLASEEIDLSDYTAPAFSYMRWYTNSPPGGANPGADWWQVQVSDDAGATWVYVENTLSYDASWRKFVFRVTDYVDITDEFMIKFNASDSIRIGQNLDGGSLIEAALDDFKIYDLANPDALDELISQESLTLYPNPAEDQITLEFDIDMVDGLDLMVYDMNGRVVMKDVLYTAGGHVTWTADIRALSSGTYTIELISDEAGSLTIPMVKN